MSLQDAVPLVPNESVPQEPSHVHELETSPLVHEPEIRPMHYTVPKYLREYFILFSTFIALNLYQVTTPESI